MTVWAWLGKKHHEGLKPAQHAWGFAGLSAHLFVLRNPALPESPLAVPGLCWSAWSILLLVTPSSVPCRSATPALTHPPLQEALRNAPARETPKPSPDLARRVHIAQEFDKQEKKQQKPKTKLNPNPPNCYQHLPSRLWVLKAKIQCKDEGNIPLVISHKYCLHSRDSQLSKGGQWGQSRCSSRER